MDRAGDRGDVNQLMQPVPALSPQPADPSFRRGDGERKQQQPRRHADGDVRVLHYVLDDVAHVEEHVEPDERGEVQRRVEEREQPEHPPVLDRFVPASEPAQRSHRERDGNEAQRPASRAQLDRLDRIRAQVVGECVPDKQAERRERREEYDRLDYGGAAREWDPLSRTCADPSRRTSAPPGRRSR